MFCFLHILVCMSSPYIVPQYISVNDISYVSSPTVVAGAQRPECPTQRDGRHQLCCHRQPPPHHLMEEIFR